MPAVWHDGTTARRHDGTTARLHDGGHVSPGEFQSGGTPRLMAWCIGLSAAGAGAWTPRHCLPGRLRRCTTAWCIGLCVWGCGSAVSCSVASSVSRAGMSPGETFAGIKAWCIGLSGSCGAARSGRSLPGRLQNPVGGELSPGDFGGFLPHPILLLMRVYFHDSQRPVPFYPRKQQPPVVRSGARIVIVKMDSGQFLYSFSGSFLPVLYTL